MERTSSPTTDTFLPFLFQSIIAICSTGFCNVSPAPYTVFSTQVHCVQLPLSMQKHVDAVLISSMLACLLEMLVISGAQFRCCCYICLSCVTFGISISEIRQGRDKNPQFLHFPLKSSIHHLKKSYVAKENFVIDKNQLKVKLSKIIKYQLQ